MRGKEVILKSAGDDGTGVALYMSAEFVAPAVEAMSLSSRWAMANMGVEIGAKFAIFEADQKTLDFLQGRAYEPFTPVTNLRRPAPAFATTVTKHAAAMVEVVLMSAHGLR